MVHPPASFLHYLWFLIGVSVGVVGDAVFGTCAVFGLAAVHVGFLFEVDFLACLVKNAILQIGEILVGYHFYATSEFLTPLEI